MHELDTAAIVIGARRVRTGRRCRPAMSHWRSRSARAAPSSSCRPTPSTASGGAVLVAVEGDGESETLGIFANSVRPDRWPEVVALHVFEADAMPLFADQPRTRRPRRPRNSCTEFRAPIRNEFGSRCASETWPKSCVRPPEVGADVVVMAWRRDLSPGHAPIVRELLSTSPVPVVLLAADAKVRAR